MTKEEVRKVVREVISEEFKNIFDINTRLIKLEESHKHILEVLKIIIENTNKRFEELREDMNARFEDMNRRFEDMNRRFTFMQWFMGAGFTILVVLITIFKFIK